MDSDEVGFLAGAFDSMRVVERHQRAQMRQFIGQEDVVYLLARGYSHVHVRWAVSGGFGGPQSGYDLPAFIRKYRDSHLLVWLLKWMSV